MATKLYRFTGLIDENVVKLLRRVRMVFQLEWGSNMG